MGNVTQTNFSRLWNADRYVAERIALEVINPDSERFLPCGECTRHCQQNLLLTDVYQNFEDDLEELEEQLTYFSTEDKPVFF
jgi:hypothetical protein